MNKKLLPEIAVLVLSLAASFIFKKFHLPYCDAVSPILFFCWCVFASGRFFNEYKKLMSLLSTNYYDDYMLCTNDGSLPVMNNFRGIFNTFTTAYDRLNDRIYHVLCEPALVKDELYNIYLNYEFTQDDRKKIGIAGGILLALLMLYTFK